jgi:hypothetical protein
MRALLVLILAAVAAEASAGVRFEFEWRERSVVTQSDGSTSTWRWQVRGVAVSEGDMIRIDFYSPPFFEPAVTEISHNRGDSVTEWSYRMERSSFRKLTGDRKRCLWMGLISACGKNEKISFTAPAPDASHPDAFRYSATHQYDVILRVLLARQVTRYRAEYEIVAVNEGPVAAARLILQSRSIRFVDASRLLRGFPMTITVREEDNGEDGRSEAIKTIRFFGFEEWTPSGDEFGDPPYTPLQLRSAATE